MYEVDWDLVADANDPKGPAGGLENSYVVKGKGLYGGCLDVQGKLAEYGVCRFARWDPGPPYWRFTFDTNLSKDQTLAVLGRSSERWNVEIE
ncbi:MAG: hypothetical protein ABFQ89_04475 [Chloroflexota bacterium]